MLEHLFSSKTRLKLLSLFLRNPDKKYYVRELTRQIDERINSVRRELENLSKMGLLSDFRNDKRRYYQVDKNFHYYKELRALIVKASTMPREKMISLIEKAGTPTLVVLSGRFTQSPSSVDLLLVGDFDKVEVKKVVTKLEKEDGNELNYSLMKTGEYLFRKEYGDRFIRRIYDGDYIELINKIDEEKKVAAPVKKIVKSF
ncbi:winged helix-turn-helix domain-containing protein [Patescibacteria group bacterium]|nr:winged helix-turn-helix domain-containing protein [Patescibacteria group bacterium]